MRAKIIWSDKNQGKKNWGDTPKPMHGKIMNANIINNYY